MSPANKSNTRRTSLSHGPAVSCQAAGSWLNELMMHAPAA